jgi:hypothetical protein
MSLKRPLFILAVVVLIILSTGCTSLAIGDVSYHSRELSVHVSNSGDPFDGGIQVRIYEIKNLNQQELTVTGIPVSVKKGENEFTVPVPLEPGTYKIYVYLTEDGERKTASIRDIVV